jgi:hypothetical protein
LLPLSVRFSELPPHFLLRFARHFFPCALSGEVSVME